MDTAVDGFSMKRAYRADNHRMKDVISYKNTEGSAGAEAAAAVICQALLSCITVLYAHTSISLTLQSAGGNGKLARAGGKVAAAAGSVAAQQLGQGESGEESGGSGMGMLKRKRTSPPESPAPYKKPTPEESGPPWSSSAPEDVPEVMAGKSEALPGDSRVTKQQVGQPHESITGMLAAEAAVVSSVEKDADGDPKGKLTTSVENLSHGQGGTVRTPPPAESPASTMGVTSTTPPATQHLIPTHAGWFNWNHIHQLERLGLPEFFSEKNKLKTPEIYKEHRNFIISKYRENPTKLLKVEDVQGLLTGDSTPHGLPSGDPIGVSRVFDFLDHWGLINYQAISDFSRFLSPSYATVEESSNGSLELSRLSKPALAKLFQFDSPRAAPTKPLTPPPILPANVPLATLVENVLQESLAAPSVKYHCNFCGADCSKRRYHCQKQADFDLCPDCYNDGKFGDGMTSTDFLRMDALTDTGDADGGGWSDQETLLLLEALELYGDNWSEIAEHVATKSKAQCILHFIRLPIEDPFLENMEIVMGGIPAKPQPETPDSKAPPGSPKDGKENVIKKESPSSYEEKEDATTKTEKEKEEKEKEEESSKDASKPGDPEKRESSVATTTDDQAHVSSDKEREKDSPAPKSKEGSTTEETVASVVLAAAEAAGFAGPDGLIPFSDAGNPVMSQVAFLAAMVGPRVAATAAQAALKCLAEEDPVGFLSAKNSFALDPPDVKSGQIDQVKSEERLVGTPSAENETPSASGAGQESSDKKLPESAPEEEEKKDEAPKLVAESGEETKDEALLIAKVKNAAAVSLASAAVKAKLLADQEEREIQRLVASVIENQTAQLKKLELKLNQFSELETMLGKECEQVEKARAKVIAERARIMQSRGLNSTALASQPQLGSTASASNSKAPPQMQATTSTSAAYTKVN
ncbi:hypothetical protein R1sor_009650 [Riccia sorocarpa]|uniref:SWI/SNF complex subunit SWI3D n=1 Tax=Riccia sorocarpa TaxID=122646 RepID=A0ABD3HXQ4_9MARC